MSYIEGVQNIFSPDGLNDPELAILYQSILDSTAVVLSIKPKTSDFSSVSVYNSKTLYLGKVYVRNNDTLDVNLIISFYNIVNNIFYIMSGAVGAGNAAIPWYSMNFQSPNLLFSRVSATSTEISVFIGWEITLQ